MIRNKALRITLIVLVTYLVLLLISYLVLSFIIKNPETKLPKDPRWTESERVKNLPKESCPCWDDNSKTCLPQQACI